MQLPEDQASVARRASGAMTGTPGATRPGQGKPPVGSSRDALYRRVCESMTCGVMLIDKQGMVEMFNPAAAEILGIERSAVIRHSFAEVFVANEDLDELNEAVLAAVYEGAVGHQLVANVVVDGRPVPLSVATSYLYELSGGERSRLGVVAVFSDISEIERLRAREQELGKDVEAKHHELREAYTSLEDRNRDLATLLRRVQVVRIAASACVIALVAGIGAWLWSEPAADGFDATHARPAEPAGDLRFVTVQPSPVASTITVPSAIKPRREVAVTSPIAGQVGAVHVKSGESVAAGQPLLHLDLTDVRIRQRNAQAAHLKAKAQMQELERWANGVDASKARRAVTKARLALEGGNNRFAETTFLVEQGLVPAARKDADEREQRSRLLDLESAEQDLEAVLAKGRERHAVARLELENATAEVRRIDRIIENANVVAPIAGVVLGERKRPGSGEGIPSTGSSIEPGQLLLTIGDVAGTTATGWVNEVDVMRILPGHAVRIAGPAFPGIVLEGKVERVSSQAVQLGGGNLPVFEIAAVVDKLETRQREAVRLGMSANMEIVIYENSEALVVPIGAVDLAEDRPRVRVLDGAGASGRMVYVTTGITTVDSVEILNGIAPGDRVAVP